jgi:glycosyltransferase involved in cell wall biosynthesis
MIKISVIIPMYNSIKTIQNAIKSIIDQTYKEPIEIIIVNDGSRDGCEKIVEELIINNHTNRIIKLLNKANGGVSTARNYGIKKSQGKL